MNIERHLSEVAENDAIRGDERVLLDLLAACNPVRLGAVWRCLCPVHGERTPSCYVKQGRDGCWRWKCFGCGKGGDAFDLVVAVEHCTFRQARERLGAKRAMPAMPPPSAGPERPGRTGEPEPSHRLVCERNGCLGQREVTLLDVAVLMDDGEVSTAQDGELRWVCRPCVRELRRDGRFYALWRMLHAVRPNRHGVSVTGRRAA